MLSPPRTVAGSGAPAGSTADAGGFGSGSLLASSVGGGAALRAGRQIDDWPTRIVSRPLGLFARRREAHVVLRRDSRRACRRAAHAVLVVEDLRRIALALVERRQELVGDRGGRARHAQRKALRHVFAPPQTASISAGFRSCSALLRADSTRRRACATSEVGDGDDGGIRGRPGG